MRCDERLERLVSGSTKCGFHATPQAIIWRNGVEQLSRERFKKRDFLSGKGGGAVQPDADAH